MFLIVLFYWKKVIFRSPRVTSHVSINPLDLYDFVGLVRTDRPALDREIHHLFKIFPYFCHLILTDLDHNSIFYDARFRRESRRRFQGAIEDNEAGSSG